MSGETVAHQGAAGTITHLRDAPDGCPYCAPERATAGEGREVCTYGIWPNGCAVGDAPGICGRYIVDGGCPDNPRHHGVAILAAALPAPAADDAPLWWRCTCGEWHSRPARTAPGHRPVAADDAPRPADDEHRDELRRRVEAALALLADPPADVTGDAAARYVLALRAALSGKAGDVQ